MNETAGSNRGERLSDINDGNHLVWFYCRDEVGCGRNFEIELDAIIARAGDVLVTELARRVTCEACKARGVPPRKARGRIVISNNGRPGRKKS